MRARGPSRSASSSWRRWPAAVRWSPCRAGGAAELFVDGEHAVGVPPSDAGALAGALAGVLADPARAAAMGRRARQRALTHHTPDRFGAQIRSAWSVPASPSGRRRAA